MSNPVIDPLDTDEFRKLLGMYAVLTFSRNPDHPVKALADLKAYLRPHIKPSEPPVSEPKPSPKPREVRREFVDGDNGFTYRLKEDQGDIWVEMCSGHGIWFRMEAAPELARLILEVHEEATRPEPPKCPWCGGGRIGFGLVDSKPGQRKFCSDCGLSGPRMPTEAEALAAFTGLRKGE